MPSLTAARTLEILLVEDNPGDVDLVRSYLRKGLSPTKLSVARDGVHAISLLRERLDKPPPPDVILLDLNLPKKSGKDVLQEIKRDAKLRHIPVIVLTSSAAPDDVNGAYELGANCYLTKSLDLAESKRVMKSIEGFWLKTVHLPQGFHGV